MSEQSRLAIDYCDDCGVLVDLHPEDTDRRTACGIAIRKAETAALMRRAAIPKGTDDPLLLALGAQRLVCKKHEESEPCSVCSRVKEATA